MFSSAIPVGVWMLMDSGIEKFEELVEIKGLSEESRSLMVSVGRVTVLAVAGLVCTVVQHSYSYLLLQQLSFSSYIMITIISAGQKSITTTNQSVIT